MINDTIKKLEAALAKLGHVDAQKKEEIRGLLASLKNEVDALSQTHGEHAKRIETHLETFSAPHLSEAVQGFEASHPKLVQTVNELCRLLAGIGI